jgi:hypothetical protein
MLDDIATELLREDAKKKGKSLRQEGIIDERRLRTIREKETSLEAWLHKESK